MFQQIKENAHNHHKTHPPHPRPKKLIVNARKAHQQFCYCDQLKIDWKIGVALEFVNRQLQKNWQTWLIRTRTLEHQNVVSERDIKKVCQNIKKAGSITLLLFFSTEKRFWPFVEAFEFIFGEICWEIRGSCGTYEEINK